MAVWKRFGPMPLFDEADLYRALWLLAKRMGRARVAQELGVGEGSARTITSILSREGLASGSPAGYKLTEKGFAKRASLEKEILRAERIGASALSFGKPAFAIKVNRKVEGGILELRDEAIKAGAGGLTLLIEKDGMFRIPEMSKKYEGETRKATAKFRPIGTLIIAYGGAEKVNERAAWKAALKITGQKLF